MQPQTVNKPVMDVAAPAHKPVFPAPVHQAMPAAHPAAAPASAAPAPVPALQPHPSPLSVAPAPADSTAPQASNPADIPSKSASPEPKKRSQQPSAGPHAPVALITVTILVMLVMAGLAVMVYLTSHPA